MNESSSSAIELPAARSAREYRYMFWLGPGFFFSIVAYYAYPPILGDSRTRPFWFMGLFVLAIVLPRMWNLVLQRPVDDTKSPAAYAVSSIAYALIALVFVLNGGLDRVPPNEMKTTVIRKVVTMQKGTHYHVIVSSWRPGEAEEDFTVDPDVYHRAAVGKAVTVEVHKGFFGVPWSGNISPD